MRKLKRLYIFMFLIMGTFLILKGPLYRACFSYESLGSKKVSKIELPIIPKVASANLLMDSSIQFVNRTLSFSDSNRSQNPSFVMKSGKANCIGYAALFCAYYNLGAQSNQLPFTAQHHKGQIYFLGKNIHQFTSKPFFKDHDFVIIINLETKEHTAVDPSVSDYLKIEEVSLR